MKTLKKCLVAGGGGFSDFFRTIFGMRDAEQAARARPQGYQQPLEISMEEAYKGTTRVLQNNGKQKQVRIPAGVRTGSKVRVAGGGPNGTDLYLIIECHGGQPLRTTRQ
jgi:curved DNA-binding protein